MQRVESAVAVAVFAGSSFESSSVQVSEAPVKVTVKTSACVPGVNAVG